MLSRNSTINDEKIRRPVPATQEPVLNEDCGNLSAVLFYLMTEHRESFEELQTHIRSAIPGFSGLNIKARGTPGEVIAYWLEDNVDYELSLADLSDRTLRFISWATLCVMPTPPTLICIDEPDQGVHPRTLPILAGLFEKASSRTQIILATHASYFLTQFLIDRIGIMKKVKGESVYVKVVARLFSNADKRYKDTVDAHWILERADYRMLMEQCGQNFKPFVEDLLKIISG